MSSRTVSCSSFAAIGVTGPESLDYANAHSALLVYLSQPRFIEIEPPEWSTRYVVIDGGIQLKATRSTWLLVTENNIRNYLEIKSPDVGFTVDVWMYKSQMRHETTALETQLNRKVGYELVEWWKERTRGNKPD